MDIETAYFKLQHYCAYRERCEYEVRNKLSSLNVYGDSVEKIIYLLQEERFLNNERFAKQYCLDKFQLKKWGRNKIIQGLKKVKIDSTLINKGLQVIDADEYQRTIYQLIEKKLPTINHTNPYIRKQKIARYLLQKGYENDLIWPALNEMMPPNP